MNGIRQAQYNTDTVLVSIHYNPKEREKRKKCHTRSKDTAQNLSQAKQSEVKPRTIYIII